ncbi:MAG: hypothetical protein Kow0042_27810 [Calditrichia bacterium]
MADIGLNQTVSIKGRKFHVQTATNLEDGYIRTEVFEQGRVIYSELNKYERRDSTQESGAELRLRRIVDQFHHNTISGLETLFELSEIIRDKQHHISHYRLGAIFLSLHLFDKAEENLMKAIDIDPDYHPAHVVLARCYYLQKRYQQAAQVLEPLVRSHIAYPDLYNLYGLILLEQKNYVHALNHFRHAIKLNPKYKEAFYNLAIAILQRINFLRMQNKKEEIQKNTEFLVLVLNKIDKIGNKKDHILVAQVLQALRSKNYGKLHSLIYDFRNKNFLQVVPPAVVGYEFYLWLRYLPDRLDYETLKYFEEKISCTLKDNTDFPDMWNYLALIHLMLCRDYFLRGLDNFKEATKINPRFTKARKNLRLVENDGREFLSLIKAIVKD